MTKPRYAVPPEAGDGNSPRCKPESPSTGDPLATDPVQLPRLLRLVMLQDAAVIRILGWPGSGRRRVLAGLARELGASAAFLSLGKTSDSGDHESLGVARESGARWFLAHGSCLDQWLEIAGRLRGDERLVVSAEVAEAKLDRESAKAGFSLADMATWSWRELGLTLPELTRLSERSLAGAGFAQSRSAVDLAALHDWSEGWLGPCESVLRAAKDSAVEPQGPWSAAPGLADFLRYRVIERLRPVEIRHLTAVSRATASGCAAEVELRASLPFGADQWDRLLHRTGWLLRGDDGSVRVPGPLAERLLDDARRTAPSRLGHRLDPARKDTAGSSADSSCLASVAATSEALAVEGSHFQLRLLGTVELFRIDDPREPERLAWPFRRVLEILASLASSPEHSCRRERVVESVWPGADGAKGARGLHPAVSHLRRLLRDPGAPGDRGASAVRLRQGVYSLANPERWWVDVASFEQLTRSLAHQPSSAEASSVDGMPLDDLQAACGLYRGPFLEGFRTPWILETRKRLAARFCRAQEAMGRAYERLGRLQDAEDAFRRVLVEDPVHEPVHLEIMRLYARRGRTDLVRRQFERLCQILLAELQMRPMDETAREVQRLIGWSR